MLSLEVVSTLQINSSLIAYSSRLYFLTFFQNPVLNITFLPSSQIFAITILLLKTVM